MRVSLECVLEEKRMKQKTCAYKGLSHGLLRSRATKVHFINFRFIKIISILIFIKNGCFFVLFGLSFLNLKVI
jgi:hypothetical protein